MLVLSRKRGEQIIIDSNIELTVLGVRGGRVQIGCAASRDVSILRGELQQRIQDSNQREPTVVDDNAAKLRGSAIGR